RAAERLERAGLTTPAVSVRAAAEATAPTNPHAAAGEPRRGQISAADDVSWASSPNYADAGVTEEQGGAARDRREEQSTRVERARDPPDDRAGAADDVDVAGGERHEEIPAGPSPPSRRTTHLTRAARS